MNMKRWVGFKKKLGFKGNEFLKSGGVHAPYLPMLQSSATGVVYLPEVKKPIYNDPIKKIKNDMGYKVEPDGYETQKFPPLDSAAIVSVQPMRNSITGVFHSSLSG